MKVSELRPCDSCSGPITPAFYRIRFDLAVIRPEAVNQFLGMHQFFHGKASPALIENFVSDNDAVTFAGDKAPSLMTTAFICHDCFFDGKFDLLMIMDRLMKEDAK